jgi:hypothetical protein
MKTNIGNTDKIVRLVVALILGGLYFAEIVTGTLGIVLLVIAAIMVLTALSGFCPLYALLGMNTCEQKES